MKKDNEQIELGNNFPGLKTVTKILFVTKGHSVDEIAEMLKGLVSRKTLYNWKKSDNWDEERSNEIGIYSRLRTELLKVVERAIEVSIKEPTADNLRLISEALSIYHEYNVRLFNMNNEYLKSLRGSKK